MNKVKQMLSDLIDNFKKYWNKPPEGRYMPYKEIASLAGGGIGVRIIVHCISQMMISTGNTLLGNTIGIDPMALQAIYMISLLTAFPLTTLRAKMIDGTRSMKGKYRPYLLTMGLPTVILGSLFIWMPYENMSLYLKCAVVLGFNIAFQFFFSFFNDSYDSLINVLSPNSIERSDVLSIRYVVENISPSIVNILFPLLARLIIGEDKLYDIKIYRYLYPPMLLLGFIISMIVYKNTTEKIVQPKTHRPGIRFFDAFRAVARNKYFWIISLAGWIGFLEVGFHNIMQWMYNYQGTCSAAQYSLITAIASNASFWPNLMGPFLIRRYGKKKILIYTNVLSVVFILCMLPIVGSAGKPSAIWMLLVVTFINQFITSLGHLLGPGVNADIRDYQHYISGERIDGMFTAVGLIGNAITMVTSLALPAIYEKAGLNREVAQSLGYDGSIVYEVLNHRDYFISICSILIVASAIGAALNAIPYLFYDFTETRQKAVVQVLKIRAALEDYSLTGERTDDFVEAVGIVKESREIALKTFSSLSGVKKNSKEYLSLSEENEKVAVAKFVVDEIEKYNTLSGKYELETAQRLIAEGELSFLSVTLPDKKSIKAMPVSDQIQQNFRRDALVRYENITAAKKTYYRCYSNGLEKTDMADLELLYSAYDKAQSDMMTLSREMKNAKENKDVESINKLKSLLNKNKNERQELINKIKSAERKYSDYFRVIKPYTDAVRVIKQAENYSNLSEYESMI